MREGEGKPRDGSTSPLRPGLTLGILGGGQLGRMLAMAAADLGISTLVLAPDEDSPAFEVAGCSIKAAYDDEDALSRLAEAVDAVTIEFENVPVGTLERIADFAPGLPIHPSGAALSITQDRVAEKRFMSDLGLATAPFAQIDDEAQLEAALALIGTPAILKTRRFGYDGKGQAKIVTPADAGAAFAAIGRAPAILEGFVAFEREVSVLVARGRDGTVASYDVCQNEHRNHILSRTLLPAAIGPRTVALARDAAERIATALGYVGLLAVEMFVVGERANEHVVMNEIAPRVHNSGHWTSEGAETSQFEQHVRAVMGLPLGSTARRGTIAMDNLLGEDMHRVPDLLATPGAHLHLYGKRVARKGRKMGHVTFVR